ncbi:MAG TPA: anti-sigma factor [Nitrospiraceae bacterium]|nr:anti-sigma factor [Nitrospiraceae bacterium]
MTHEEIEDAIPLYAIGALDRSERTAVESHLLTGCGTCHVLAKDYQAVAGLLPFGLRSVTPPSKSTVLAAVFQNAASDEGGAVAADGLGFGAWINEWLAPFIKPSLQPVISVVLLILLAGTGWYAWMTHRQVANEAGEREQIEAALHDASTRTAALQQDLTQQEQALASLKEEVEHRIGTVSDTRNKLIEREAELDIAREQLSRREQETANLRKALAQRDDMLTFLRSAHVKVVSLAGIESAKSAGAFLLYDNETKKAFFYAFNMPELPPGKTYQLWAIVDKPMSAGTFRTDSGHKSRVVLKDLPDLSRISKFAVSLEPEGGRPQPTGTIYLAGQT